MREGGEPGEYAVHAVGVVLSGSALAYMLVRDESLLVELAQIAFPLLLGVLVTGYGSWLRHEGLSGNQLGTIAIGSVLGGAAFAFFTGWLLYVATLEIVIPANTTFILLNGIAIGVITGGFLGTLFVSLRDRQAELRAQNRELRRQNERLDQFASIVSHDLRNPLNVAQGRIDLAMDTGEQSHLEAIDGALDRMEAIIADMLAFARQGKAVEDVTTVTLESVAESAWETVGTAGIELVPEGSLRFEAHESRLCQGLENLFRNATEHGGEEISTVWIGPLESRGFYVEDDGVGISPEDRDDVFDSGFSSTAEGTGFGLPIVKAVMEAHGWTIDLSEGRDGGARFEIRFGE